MNQSAATAYDSPPAPADPGTGNLLGVHIRADLDIDDDRLDDICRRHSVIELSLFGSVLRDHFGMDSDIDLLYVFAPGARVGWAGIYELDQELTELFGRQVDLVPKRHLSPAFEQHVLARAHRLYAA